MLIDIDLNNIYSYNVNHKRNSVFDRQQGCWVNQDIKTVSVSIKHGQDDDTINELDMIRGTHKETYDADIQVMYKDDEPVRIVLTLDLGYIKELQYMTRNSFKNIDVDFTFYDKNNNNNEELFELTYNKFRVDNLNFNYSLNGNNELILTIEKRLMTKNDKAQNKDLDGLIYHMINIYRNNNVDDYMLNIELYGHE